MAALAAQAFLKACSSVHAGFVTRSHNLVRVGLGAVDNKIPVQIFKTKFKFRSYLDRRQIPSAFKQARLKCYISNIRKYNAHK